MDKTSAAPDKWYGGKRIGGLWRFALAISILNILGHTVFGFEQAWAHPLVALAAAYGTDLLIETVDAWCARRPPTFAGSWRNLLVFLLPAHITGLAVGMLLFANQRFWVVAFAASTAVASKWIFRYTTISRTSSGGIRSTHRHYLNPSNFGIVVTLLLFPSVGIAPPYQFTENLRGPLDVLLPLLIFLSGTVINLKFTDRMPLILAWVGTFALQALLRSWALGLPWESGLVPMSGLAFILFTFYMVTDPGTTPAKPAAQMVFGCAVALTYGLLMVAHVVFGLFFSLALVTAVRGLMLHKSAWKFKVEARLPAAQPSSMALPSK